ncbi:MAG: L-ribulose-5-phosphate 3-epimerase [Spirochaetaceae bacterium]
MYSLDKQALGIYEKALPSGTTWKEKLEIAKETGFDFIEISIDETDMRLSRLDWSQEERNDLVKDIAETGIRIPSMCLSGHRKYPLGSEDPDIRNKALDLMKKGIELAVDLGIRNIQLAGYDVYYSAGNSKTRENFLNGLRQAVSWASKAEVMLSMEIMDHPLMNSISRFLEYSEEIPSPWFTVYPDIGNISAWGNDIEKEFTKGINKITSIHLKDTLAVSGVFNGKFKEVPFGEGCVDFPDFFRILNILNYKGPFLIEMWTEKSDKPIEDIKKARSWMLEKMEEGGYHLC